MSIIKRSLVTKIILWILIVLGSIVVVAGLFVGFMMINFWTYKIPEQAETIENNTGLIQASGRSLYDKNGNAIRLEGTNVGNMFVQEGWISPVSDGTLLNDDGTVKTDGDGNAEYPELPQEAFLAALNSNPNLTDAQIDELFDVCFNNWFSEEDYQNIKDLGMNCLRLPIYWRDILNEDYTRKEESLAFKYIDKFLEGCRDYEIYCIIDMHGAPKSQNGYEHSGIYKGEPELFEDEDAINALADIWDYISEHYMKEENSDISAWIASYDIMNEPCDKTYHASTKKTWNILDKCYDKIRENGDLHNIAMGSCWTFANLPDPEKYGWENVLYEYHWYNWYTDILPYDLFYAYQDLSNIGRNYNVPVFIGEFTFFENEAEWNKGLNLFKERNYSWTTWTYKKTVVGWWNDSWGIYNYKLNLTPYEETKVNIKTATFEEIKEVWLNSKTYNCEKSTTYDILKKYLENE